MPREVASDCRYFLGDRPCIWHKREGLLCICERFDPVREHILLIKLDAMGDVLRTTALLPLLAKAHPRAALTWITRPESKPLLENNPYLAEVVSYGADSLVHLLARSFDRVINLDAGKLSAGLATAARSPRKDGFLLHEKGHVVPTNEAARRWLEMGIFDDLKRANTRTYQSVMAEILDLPSTGHHYVLELKGLEQEKARTHLQSLGLNLSRPIVGLNTGAGGRWPLKQWRLDGFQELIERLDEESEVQVLLLGGKTERDRHEWLKKHAQAPVFDSGNDNDLRHFTALTAQCAVVVTGDTLAMHVALATGRRVVVLFGPTSAAEIELYGLGEKVVPEMDCLVCYKPSCNYVSKCMDEIGVDMVAEAVKRQLRPASPRSLSLAVL
ncbi:MAG TPA: glycosyltransferase family 9 protein [Gemmataceae bacterium]|nr:glycosyltransferase family 9 protein [Gemmataceae bacterium]